LAALAAGLGVAAVVPAAGLGPAPGAAGLVIDCGPRDGNVAGEASVTVDSETDGYPAASLNDGTAEYSGATQGRSWCSAETAQEHWVTFELPGPETMDTVLIYWACYPRGPDTYNTARDVDIQYRREGQWVSAGRHRNPIGMYRTVCPCPPFTASAVRLVMPAGEGPVLRPNILWMNEVRLCRAGTWPGPQAAADGRSDRCLTGDDGTTLVRGVGAAGVPVVSGVAAGGLDEGTPGDALALRLGGPGNSADAPAGAQITLRAGDQPIGDVRVTVAAVVPEGQEQSLAVFWDGLRLGEFAPSPSGLLASRTFAVPASDQRRTHILHLAALAAGATALVDAIRVECSGALEIVRPLPYEPTPRLTDGELFAALDLARPGLERVREALAKGDPASARTALVSYFVGRTAPPRPGVRHDPLYYPDALPRDPSADQWLAGRYYLYKTYGWVELGRPIDWFLPQGSPSDRYYITCMTLMHFMVDRWQQTGDARYLQAYMADIRSWYETAPSPLDPPVFPAHCLPWSGIETAFRAGSVTEDYFRMCESPLLSPDYHILLYKLILEHARFLTRCDGGRLFPANHQMGHLVGLLELAAYWPEFAEAGHWKVYTRDLLQQHFRADLYPDGGNLDLGLDYAVMVINRMYTPAYLLAEVAGIDLGPEWWPALHRQLRWALNVTDPSGGHLGIGDSSPRTDFPSYDYGGRSTTAVRGALLFGDPVMKHFAEMAAPGELEAWAQRLFAARAPERLAVYREVQAQPPDWTSVNLPDTGWTILRSDWSPQALYLFVDHHRGGHIHHNMNDINVVAYGRQFLTDPGMPHTYSDGSYASWYQRTRAHNTIEVDGQDMPYATGDRGTFFTGGPFDFLAVSSDVYKGIGVTTYLRQVLFIRDGLWVVDDYLAGQGEHSYRWLGHYQPMPLTVDADAGAVLTANADGPNLGLFATSSLPLAIRSDHGLMNIPCDHLCEEVPDAPYVALAASGALPIGFGVLLLPTRQGTPTGSVRRTDGGDGVAAGAAYEVTTPRGTGYAAFSHADPRACAVGPLALDGRAAFACGSPASPRRLLLVGGTHLTWDSRRVLELPREGTAAIEVAEDQVGVWTDLTAGEITVAVPRADRVTLNGQPVAFTRNGDVVTVRLP